MKALLVDDCAMVRRLQRKVLAELGDVEFVEARDGVEALNAVRTSGPFDVILVDWKMPRMDGQAFVNCVRDSDKVTPLIMVTSEADRKRVVTAIQSGVNDFVIKPFAPAKLLEKVRIVLKRNAA